MGRGRELDRKAGGRIDNKVFELTGLCFTAAAKGVEIKDTMEKLSFHSIIATVYCRNEFN